MAKDGEVALSFQPKDGGESLIFLGAHEGHVADPMIEAGLTLQRHLQNMLFYHKGLRVRKKPLPFVACDRKAAILRVQIWSAHESDVVGLNTP
jgi:hypothetical protein